jgi:hypothetical protein
MGVGPRSQECLLGLVTREARGRSTRHELMRLVAPDALPVSRGLGGLLLRVAGRAGRERGARGSVTTVAIEASSRPAVLRVGGRDLLVARRAGLGYDRGFAVKLVTLCALGGRVHRDGGERTSSLRVARDARRRLVLGREGMAGQTRGLRLSVPGVSVAYLGSVTLRAGHDAWILEAVVLEVVAPAARDLR